MSGPSGQVAELCLQIAARHAGDHRADDRLWEGPGGGAEVHSSDVGGVEVEGELAALAWSQETL